MWPFILTLISAVLFFGFVALCVKKFGLESCYSAYGPHWAKTPPFTWTLNPWNIVTLLTAAMLVPVLITAGEGSPWQFTGFICPAMLLFVALTPDYGRNPLSGKVHSICAAISAVFSVIFLIAIAPKLWWLLLVVYGLAGLCTLYYGKYYWCFFAEMAAYLSIYVGIFIMIFSK